MPVAADPWSAGIAAVGGFLGGPNGPVASGANGGTSTAGFNDSGWSVATGKARNSGSSSTSDPLGVTGAAGAVAQPFANPELIAAALVAVIAVALIARRK